MDEVRPAGRSSRSPGRGRAPGAEKRWADLGTFVREQRGEAQLSLRRLSDLSGISNPYLSQIERGLRRPSADILQQLARALELAPESLYVRAGILDADEGAPDLVAAIRRDPELGEAQKRTLIHVYEALRLESGARRVARAGRVGESGMPEGG
ncbi:MAG: helix-turn-helix domain-containing protein [Acidimicrobiia bacterium]|nr:helix-turn-helix domain-containing protein [Acidimicrobiia bacterium]